MPYDNHAGRENLVKAGGDMFVGIGAGANPATLSTSTAGTGSGNGAKGDYVETLLCTVTDPVNSRVMLQDGSGGQVILLPPNVAGGIGLYTITLGIRSTVGPWKVYTQSGVTVLATGDFT